MVGAAVNSPKTVEGSSVAARASRVSSALSRAAARRRRALTRGRRVERASRCASATSSLGVGRLLRHAICGASAATERSREAERMRERSSACGVVRGCEILFERDMRWLCARAPRPIRPRPSERWVWSAGARRERSRSPAALSRRAACRFRPRQRRRLARKGRGR